MDEENTKKKGILFVLLKSKALHAVNIYVIIKIRSAIYPEEEEGCSESKYRLKDCMCTHCNNFFFNLI